MASTASRPGILIRMRDYALDVKGELEKVTWPSRDDLKSHTLVVLFFLGLLGAIIGALDAGFQRAVLSLFKML